MDKLIIRQEVNAFVRTMTIRFAIMLALFVIAVGAMIIGYASA